MHPQKFKSKFTWVYIHGVYAISVYTPAARYGAKLHTELTVAMHVCYSKCVRTVGEYAEYARLALTIDIA
eukprot:1267321-Pyramimonas_sp.AAC.1